MSAFDFDEIEEDLDLTVPEIYRIFIQTVEDKGYDLAKYGIYHNTETVLKGNWFMRLYLGGTKPKWKDHYLDFGVGDGCGNYFYLIAKDEDDDKIQLWSHDPPGIENVSSGTEFFRTLLQALHNRFEGLERYYFDGTAGRFS